MEWLEQFCKRMEQVASTRIELARQNGEGGIIMFNEGVLSTIRMLKEEMEAEK